MSAPTKQEMLDTVKTAINLLSQGAKSYSIGGRTVTHRDISELEALRKKLEQELSPISGRTSYATFKDPS